MLQPGDTLFVPPLEPKTVALATTRVHRFRRRGIPSKLKLRFLVEGEPVADQPYTLLVGDLKLTGTTDGEGRIERDIPPGAKHATVYLEDETYRFSLGGIDPRESLAGIAQRLHNLGYDCDAGESDSDPLEAAIRLFQSQRGLHVTGVADAATRDAIAEEHGC